MVSSGHENSLNVMNPDRGGSGGAHERSKAIIPVNAIKQRPSFSGSFFLVQQSTQSNVYKFIFCTKKRQDKWQGRGKSCGSRTCIEKCIQHSGFVDQRWRAVAQAGSSPPLHIRAQGIIEPAQTSLKWYKWSTGWGHLGTDMTLCFAHTLLNIS